VHLSPGSEPRILVIGAGSAGTRHARNLQRLGAHVALMDPDPQRVSAVRGVEPLPFDLTNFEGYDGIVIASPSAHHFEQISAALAGRAKVLVEKPLATTTDDLDALVARGTGRVMVGYNLRLHEPVVRLVGWLHSGRVGRPLTLRLWFGYYLPAWRPSVDYRISYSARAALGGGVLFDAIHELDLLVWMLGADCEVVGAVVDRLSDLDIDVEDTVRALLRHRDGTVIEIELDYLSQRYRRGIEVVGSEGTMRLDWAEARLEWETEEESERLSADVPLDRSYELEAEAFLAFVQHDATPPVDAATGAASVRLAEQIRAAARERPQMIHQPPFGCPSP
jgi:predicted dehydrogenase